MGSIKKKIFLLKHKKHIYSSRINVALCSSFAFHLGCIIVLRILPKKIFIIQTKGSRHLYDAIHLFTLHFLYDT